MSARGGGSSIYRDEPRWVKELTTCGAFSYSTTLASLTNNSTYLSTTTCIALIKCISDSYFIMICESRNLEERESRCIPFLLHSPLSSHLASVQSHPWFLYPSPRPP